MAATKVGIINLGLSHIGQKAIASIEESTVQRIAATRVWEYVLKEALASKPWGFAMVVEALSELSDYEPLEYAYAYAYPSTAVRVWSVYDEGCTKKTIGEKFRVVYSKDEVVKAIETNVYQAYAEYTHYLIDVTQYDPHFITALSHRLAAELAVPLNGDKDMAKDQLVIFNNLTSEAHRFSEHERNEDHQANKTSGFVDARG